ncbi:MAG: dimethylsulfonioproprionate lyase family protein [Alphaproteobacteria bacterium]
MTPRSPDLQAFLDTLQTSLCGAVAPDTAAGRMIARAFAALATPAAAGTVAPSSLPTNGHLGGALASAATAAPAVARHAAALGALTPRLAWHRRDGAEQVGPAFYAGHANAIVVGRGGLEPRADVLIGISLLAPTVAYPEHRHPPEEVYLVLSPGEWRQEDGPWHAPGPGGIVHNRPGIRHVMRAGAAPLLATWCLWTAAATAE